MVVSATWPQVLAWRLKRQFVDPADGPDAVSVVRRLTGVQAQVASSAGLAVPAAALAAETERVSELLRQPSQPGLPCSNEKRFSRGGSVPGRRGGAGRPWRGSPGSARR